MTAALGEGSSNRSALFQGTALVGGLLAAAAAGVASSLAASSAKSWFAVIAVILLPSLLVVSAVSASTAAGFLTFAQVFEAFEFATPIATVSIGSVALLAFLAVRWRQIAGLIAATPPIRALATVALVFISSHALQFLHTDTSLASRGLITVTGFVAFWLVGVAVGGKPDGRRALALGSLAALLFLATVGALASEGLVPPPARVSDPRSFLGFVSPFKRNYGLDPGFTSVALLLPLCVPWLSMTILKGRHGSSRIAAVLGYGALCVATLLIFQSRSMLCELAIGLGLVALLLRVPVVLRVLTAVIAIALALYATPAMLGADPISADLRSSSFSYTWSRLQHQPAILLTGTDKADFASDIQVATRFGYLVPGAPVHNAFLDEVLTGGILCAGSLAVLIVVPMWQGWRLLRRQSERRDIGIMVLAGASVMLFEIMVNPAQANVAGLWLTLGAIAAMSFASTVEQ